ncbi:hypothetical protein E1295_29370 [Nonomuraea mesophila]|uniref:Uncharacterized protein n=1 Tax=Nonomuraea mesophila TaxID=2530382 RepID=A0A4R5F2I1_9ACTN|nr:hypothetical protein [Nonomuraea mesophila]TDE41653.1 hypothetical protein E1295_29370 [Nonomuraea mesophila]
MERTVYQRWDEAQVAATTTVHDVIKAMRASSDVSYERGTAFERLMVKYLSILRGSKYINSMEG